MSKVRCKGCREYVEKDSAIRSGLSSFCSQSCLYDSRNTQQKKRPKKISAKQTEKFPEHLRNLILTKDSHRCRLCGKSSHNLAVHHVIYKSDKKNKQWQDQTSNLITLCNEPCHLSIVHKNKKVYQSLCLGIIWLREVEGDRYTTINQLKERLNNE